MKKLSDIHDISKDYYKDELKGTEWLGLIVDNTDPNFMGRCKVRIYEKYDDITDADLPWVYPANNMSFAGGDSSGYGSFSCPKVGSLVRVRFNLGDEYHPEYYSVENINESLKSEISGSYTNAQCLVYDEDEDIKIIYTQSSGWMFWNKGCYINLSNSGDIYINHSDDTGEIILTGGDITIRSAASVTIKTPATSLDTGDCRLGSGAAHPAVKGDELVQLLFEMATAIDAKVPSGIPGPTLLMVQNSDILSSNVFVSD